MLPAHKHVTSLGVESGDAALLDEGVVGLAAPMPQRDALLDDGVAGVLAPTLETEGQRQR